MLGAGPEVAGISLAFFAGGTALALTVSGRLADSLGRKPLVLTGLAVNGAAMAGLGLTTDVVAFLAVSVIAGIGAGILNPAQQAAVADVIGNERSGGKVLAAFQMSTDTGAIFGPILAGLLVDAFSYGWAFGLTGVTALAAFLMWTAARETLGEAGQPVRRPPAAG